MYVCVCVCVYVYVCVCVYPWAMHLTHCSCFGEGDSVVTQFIEYFDVVVLELGGHVCTQQPLYLYKYLLCIRVHCHHHVSLRSEFRVESHVSLISFHSRRHGEEREREREREREKERERILCCVRWVFLRVRGVFVRLLVAEFFALFFCVFFFCLFFLLTHYKPRTEQRLTTFD